MAIERYAALGVPDGTGYYIASRAAPLAPAGNEAVTAAFFSIHPAFIEVSLDLARQHTTFDRALDVRNGAVADGLRLHVPEVVDALSEMGPALWDAADHLDPAGRVLFAAHHEATRTDDPLCSAWLAVNAIREWRGDTHWAVVIANGLSGVQAGLLHDAWMGYPGDWIPRSRGADDEGLTTAIAGLTERGLATDGIVNEAGIELRQGIEDTTDRISEEAWRHLGPERTEAFIALIEPLAERFLTRIDETAGTNWMPAARPRRR